MMRRSKSVNRWVLSGCCLSLFASACGGSPDASSTTNGGTGGIGGNPSGAAGATIENPCGTVDATLADADANALFGVQSIPTFQLQLPAEDWAALQKNARDEQFVEAQACFEGKAIGRVGLRFKGSYGSLFNCFDAAGVNTCRKLGMKLKFDYVDADQRFFGLKRLNFQSYRWDESYMKERLSSDLYHDMGIVVPRVAWAKLRVNGEEQGLFGMTEEIDGRFTHDRWPDNGDANLYKEVWPSQFSEEWAKSQLKTNEEVGDVSSYAAFAADLAAATEPELRATLGRYMDLDHWARYMAVDDAIANLDGIITYYTTGSAAEAGNHNFYIYEDAPGHFQIIPWDLESTMSLDSGYGNVPFWQTTPADCSKTYLVWGGPMSVAAPGCDRLFKALSSDLTGYQAAVHQLLDGPFSLAVMDAKIDANAAFLREAAHADPHGFGETAFENSIPMLHQSVRKLRSRLEFMLSGKSTTPFELTGTTPSDFETADAYGLTLGTMQMSNGHTTASVALNQTDPIAGAQSLRILFNFGNETKAWEQWTIYHVPLAATAPHDLTTLTGMRFKARSDRPRVLRVDLLSPKNTASNEGIQFGWDVRLTKDAAPYEVTFAQAALPSWARDPGDLLLDVLKTTSGISYQPMCDGRNAAGQLPDGTTDEGWVELDDIVFF